ncbi:MAG: S8 family serine peptidase [Thermoanaerobaculaceae bacterium]|jgi:subtilisin family serine protease|nr:S8 family serine peptidase [Thermoanaerobaculaceae bacterium]
MPSWNVLSRGVAGMTMFLAAGVPTLAAHGPSRLPNGRVVVAVELESPPAAEVWARGMREAGLEATLSSSDSQAQDRLAAATRAHLQIEDSEQQAVLDALAASGTDVSVVFRTQRVLNAIALEVEESSVAALAELPGVKAVHPLALHTLGNSTSVPWIGAPTTWSGLATTGKGVRIGIIDSGVDYLHRDFGGSGSYTGQSFDDNVVPWNAKVVGGTDLAGDDYDGSASSARPDGDPMDCEDNGHGTHVAGSAAGYGVTSGGQTYAGPWQPGLDPGGFLIGPGVAPEAQLYAIRIFGCSGSSALTIAGLEWASDPNRDGNLSDRLDVVNLSLGSAYGAADPSGERAIDTLVSLGTVVVAAAGNDGDLYTIVGSPSSADNALSVASCADDGVVGARLRIETPATLAGEVPSTTAQFGTPPTAAGVTAAVAAALPADGCGALTNPGDVAGRIALVDRGTCNFTVKVKNAQVAGATAVIVADNRLGPLVAMGGEDASVTIPSVLISQPDGTTLRGALPGGVTATLRSVNLAATVASSSSRGPRGDDLVLKPEVTAPGVAITSAKARSGSEGTVASGTSMATPHVAGVAAVLRQLHPTWSAAELKAAIMDTARPELPVPAEAKTPLHGAGRVGAGRVDTAAAAATTLLACDDNTPGRVALSFGPVEAVGVTRVRRIVRVTATTAAVQSLTLSYEPMVRVPGVTVELPEGPSLTVPASGVATFPVELVVDAAAVHAVRDPGAAASQDGLARHYLVEESGHVVLAASGGVLARVPLHAVIRPASALALDVPAAGLTIGTTATTAELTFTGSTLGTPDNDPTSAVAMVSPLELVWTNPATPPSRDRFGVIRWLGVTSDAPQRGGMANATLVFGIAVHGPWSSPRDVAVAIEIDTNRDGTTDWRLATTDHGAFVSTGQENPWASDVFGATLSNQGTSAPGVFIVQDRLPPGTGAMSVFGTEVMLLAVPASALGLGEASSQVSFKVSVSPADSMRTSDSPAITYDFARPGLSPAAGMPPLPLAPGQTLPLRVDQQAFTGRGSGGLLLLVHTNTTGARAAAVPVVFADCSLTPCPAVTTNIASGTRQVTLSAAAAPACSPVDYEWDFGDGSAVGSGSTVTHAYSHPGSYTWHLTVRAAGQSCTTSGTVTLGGEIRRRLPRG